MSKNIDGIQNERKSNALIMLLLAANAVLTGIFAWNYLGGVFGELTGQPVGDILIRVLAVVLTVAAFDGAFHSWASIGKRPGLSLEQITTAGTAKSVAMTGSVIASFAQVILGQTEIAFPPDLLFFIAIVALISVAVVLILHVIWWDKFNDESFDAVERKFESTESATRQSDAQKQKQTIAKAEADHERQRQALILEQRQKEQALELKVMREKIEIANQVAEDDIAHTRAINEQSRKHLERGVDDIAQEVAQIQGAEALRNFRIARGVTAAPLPFPHEGVTQMAADGGGKGAVIHRVVKDAHGNIVSEEELPDLYAPVSGNAGQVAVRSNTTTDQRTVKDVMTGINAPYCVLAERIGSKWVPQPSEHGHLVTFEDLRKEINEKQNGWWAIMNRKEDVVVQRDLTFGPCEIVRVLELGVEDAYFPKV